MIKKAKMLFSDSLFKDSGIIFVSSVLVNVFNLVFWLVMVRKLNPPDYGVLNSLISVLMLFSVPASVLQMVLTRYVSKFKAQDKEGDIRAIFFVLGKIVLIFFAFLVLIFILYASPLSRFLNIFEERALLNVICLGVIFSTCMTMVLGVLSGLQKFNDVALCNFVSGAVKLAIGILLVLLGFRSQGALWGFVLSFLVGFVYAYNCLPDGIRRLKSDSYIPRLNFKEIYSYFFPVALSMLCFFLLTNIDIILVKHYFSPLLAGYYSVAQTVGKIVLFVPCAIGLVMFPKVVDAHTRNTGHLRILKKCLLAVGALCGSAMLVSLFFPGLLLKILTGHSQPLAVSLVKFFAINMGFLALVNILMLYHLSLHHMRFIYGMVFVSLLEVVGIVVFHGSLEQVLWVVLVCSVILFVAGLKLIRSDISYA